MKLGYFLRNNVSRVHQLTRQFFYWYEYLAWKIFHKNKENSKEIENLLMVNNNAAIGDAFCSVKIAYNLKLDCPKLTITLVLPEIFAKDFKFLEKPTKLRIISEKQLQGNFDASLLFSFTQYIKDYQANLGVIAGNEYHSILGSVYPKHYFFINKKISPKHIHKIEQEKAIANLLGFKFKENLSTLSFSNKKSFKENYAVIHPCGKDFLKTFKEGKIPAYSWEMERFAKIADYLIENKKLKVIFSGTKEEEVIIQEIIKKMKNKATIFSDNLENLASLISGAKILIGVDTSIIHIAELTSTPLVVLIGPSFPEVIGAYGNPKQINLFNSVSCSKCRKKGACPEGKNICMSSISVEQVISKIKKLSKIFI